MFVELVKEFQTEVDFLTIYVKEAHPTDGWDYDRNDYYIKTHKSLEERLAAARLLNEKELPCEIVVDPMTDECSNVYAAAPERLYIIQDGTISYPGRDGPMGYTASLGEVRYQLNQYVESKKQK